MERRKTSCRENNVDKLKLSRRAAARPDLGQRKPLDRLPFEAVFSLEPLLAFWRALCSEPGRDGLGPLYAQVEAVLQAHPALSEPIADPDLLREHQAFLDLLMLPVFPPAFRESSLAAALVPFAPRAFYATSSFERFFTREPSTVSGAVTLDAHTYTYGKVITAYQHILRNVYGLDLPFEHPVLFTTADLEMGLERHFRLHFDLRFIRVEQVGEMPPVTEALKRDLTAHVAGLDTWMKLIPPDTFAFYGFDVMHAVEVTDDEVVSLLKYDLLEGEGLVSGSSYPTLLSRMRTLLQKPDIQLGLAAIEDGQLFLINKPAQEDCLFSRSNHYDLAELKRSLFGHCLQDRALQIVADLAAHPDRTALEDEMLRGGARNVIAAPLYFQDRAVGILYLWSARPGELDALNVVKLLEVLPLFAAAVRRGKEELRNRVQAVILEEYTAIHPSVEWRFRKAALNFIRKQEQGLPAEVEPILFEEVYPLYAAADIRGSATHRNEAVRCDLLEHVNAADKVLRAARDVKPLPLLDHLLMRLQRHRTALEAGLSSGDEATTREFLQRSIEPLFSHLRTFAPSISEAIDAYHAAIDPRDGILYRRCRDFEQSVARINRTISTYLDAEERKAQALCPHYFEKHQTDGIDFSIYVGAALLEEGPFDPLYVKNLRLWQLMVMCGIACRVEPLKQSLPVPLETTHLILVQSMPVSIRFRFDETRFDVEGAQHIRYEIMKQRVEKASLKGRSERLTQPGKLAIVYSQAREALEYEEYIQFLQEIGYVTGEVERVDLDDLQGMKGLKALRVQVALDTPPEAGISPAAIEQAVRSMPPETN